MLTDPAQSRGPDNLAREIRDRLDPLLERAKASEDLADWAPLARTHWQGYSFSREFCRRFAGKAQDSLWYEALRNYGMLSDSQVDLLNRAWRAVRSESMSRVKVAFTSQQLVDWAEQLIRPLVSSYLAVDNKEKRVYARVLAAAEWENDRHFHSFLREMGHGSASWYNALQRYFRLSDQERQFIEDAARDYSREQAATRNRRHNVDDLRNWAMETLVPLLLSARGSNTDADWAKLAGSRFSQSKEARAFCYAFSPMKVRNDIAGALAAIVEVSPEEVERIRTAGREFKGQIRSERHRAAMHTPVEQFKQNILLPLIQRARESRWETYLQAWDELRKGHWANHPCFRAFCVRYSLGQSPFAWTDALTSAFKLSFEEQYLLRSTLPAMAAVRKRNSQRIVTPIREDSLHTDAQSEAMVLERTLAESDKRVIIPRVSSSIFGRGPVFQQRGTKRQASEAQKLRAKIAAIVRGGRQFDPIATELNEARRFMLSTHTTELAVRFLIQEQDSEARALPWPRRILSAASGSGTLHYTFERLSHEIIECGLTVPQVFDLDRSAGVAALSQNPRRIIADMRRIPLLRRLPSEEGGIDAVECSSWNTVNAEVRAAFLLEAGALLPPGGLLWLKLDRAYFHSSFDVALHAAGFVPVLPINTELLSLPYSSAGSKIPGACYRTRFVFAKRNGEPDPLAMNQLVQEGMLVINRRPMKEDPLAQNASQL